MYATGSAAGDYDILPYDAKPIDLTSLETVLSISGQWGMTAPIVDVLDLGCGFGRQLAQVAPNTTGRLVGIDASSRTCVGARDVLSTWSDRVTIHEGYFENFDSNELGDYDLIYCIGAFYTVPRPARDAALRLMGECLRPGGRILMTYYAGTRGAIHSAVGEYIRALQPGAQLLPDAIATAREHLAASLRFQTPAPIEAVRQQISGIAGYDDIVLFHEILGHGVNLQSTAEINTHLLPYNINFQGYMGYDPVNFDCDLLAKLYRAETLDLLEGGYRYALFGKSNL